MSKFRTALLAGAMVVGFGAAEAAPIKGTIGFSGIGSFDTTEATINLAFVLLTSGSFTIINNLTPVNFTTPLEYDTGGGSPTLGLIWDLTDGGNAASFTASSGSVILNSLFVDFVYFGTLTLTGFDPTAGRLTISMDGNQNANIVFSANTVTIDIPEPASLALLGMGLLGLGFAARRRAA